MNANSASVIVVLNWYSIYDFYMNYEDNIYTNLGKNIKKYRIQRGLSQEKLSELLEVNSKFVGHVERLERHISLRKLIQLSKILEVPINQLFDFGN